MHCHRQLGWRTQSHLGQKQGHSQAFSSQALTHVILIYLVFLLFFLHFTFVSHSQFAKLIPTYFFYHFSPFYFCQSLTFCKIDLYLKFISINFLSPFYFCQNFEQKYIHIASQEHNLVLVLKCGESCASLCL